MSLSVMISPSSRGCWIARLPPFTGAHTICCVPSVLRPTTFSTWQLFQRVSCGSSLRREARPRTGTLAQPHRLQRLAAFHLVCQRAAHLRDKSALILRIPQRLAKRARRPAN